MEKPDLPGRPSRISVRAVACSSGPTTAAKRKAIHEIDNGESNLKAYLAIGCWLSLAIYCEYEPDDHPLLPNGDELVESGQHLAG